MVSLLSTLESCASDSDCLVGLAVFTAPTLASDGASACLDKKKDGTSFIPSRAKFQSFTCNSFQCVWYLRLGSGAAPADADNEAAVQAEINTIAGIEKWWRKKFEKQGHCAMAETVAALPQLLEINRGRREAKFQKKMRKRAKLQGRDEARSVRHAVHDRV